MNKIKKVFTIFLIFFLIYILFRYNYILNKSINDAVNLWLNNIFPSLFIMFIINDLIINTNVLNDLAMVISPLFNKIFTTDGLASLAFILSIFSGSPTSAFIIKKMYDNQNISLESANKLLSFTYFSNPLFLYNILSLTFNKFIIFKIIIIHYLSNIIIGLLMRKKNNNTIFIHTTKNYNNLFSLLPNAIKVSINTLFMILGTISFYLIITNIITNLIHFNPVTDFIFRGIIEITQALKILNLISLKSIIKEIMAIFIISFGGLSIHTQVLSLINESKIQYKYFLIGRIYHALISTCTYIFISCIIIN